RILERGYDRIIGATLSPDASQLVFVGYKGGNGELAVVEAKAGAKPNVVAQGAVGWHPDWSPQGKKLLFRTQVGAMEQLQILDLLPRPLANEGNVKSVGFEATPFSRRLIALTMSFSP